MSKELRFVQNDLKLVNLPHEVILILTRHFSYDSVKQTLSSEINTNYSMHVCDAYVTEN